MLSERLVSDKTLNHMRLWFSKHAVTSTPKQLNEDYSHGLKIHSSMENQKEF